MQEDIHTLEALNEGDDLEITIENGNTVPLTVSKIMDDSGIPKAILEMDGQTYANLWGYRADIPSKEMEIQSLNCKENDIYTVTDIEVA